MTDQPFAGNLGGAVFIELRSDLYEQERKPLMINYVYGLGGRDLHVDLVEKALNELADAAGSGQVKEAVNYLGRRE